MRTPVDATRGPLLRALVRLAIPVVAMQACHTLFHLVNVMWVGRLGASATAAVTTSFFVIWIYALADLPGVAVAATVSRHVGARDADVRRIRARESVSCFARSSFVDNGLAVVAIAPKRASASIAIGYSGVF